MIKHRHMTQARLDVAALYASLEQKRRTLGQSWRTVATSVDVSPSTFTRMRQGHNPDLASFARLVDWLGVPADLFMVRTEPAASNEFLPEVSAFLRARKELTPKSAAALEDVIRAAYALLAENSKEKGR